jgi:hypothetical protein
MAVGTSGIESEPNEETCLLPSATTARPTKAKPTPLPKLQLSILFLLQFSEPICSQVSSADGLTCVSVLMSYALDTVYISIHQRGSPITRRCSSLFRSVLFGLQLITEFNINGGDEKATGYYAGVIVGCLYL